MAFGVRCPGCFKVPMSITPVSSGRALARMAETGSLLRGAAAPLLALLAWLRGSRQREAAAEAEAAAAPSEQRAAATSPPEVPLDLVIRERRRRGEGRRVVLRIQDTGGQPIFLAILELLTTAQATLYVVVFSLADLNESFEGCAEQAPLTPRHLSFFPTIRLSTHLDTFPSSVPKQRERAAPVRWCRSC